MTTKNSTILSLLFIAITNANCDKILAAPILSDINTVLVDHEDLEPIRDTPYKKIDEILLFAGSQNILPLQMELMKALPDVTYYVLPAAANKIDEEFYRKTMAEANVVAPVNFVKFNKPLTDWTQDRVLRFRHQKTDKSVILPVLTDTLFFNEFAPFEIGVPRALEDQYPEIFERFEHHKYYSELVVDSKSGEVYPYSPYYAHWFRGSVWNISYGDGGDRFTTESTMFVGAGTLKQMLSHLKNHLDVSSQEFSLKGEAWLKRIFKVKQIVPVGDVDPAKTYMFHVDVFLTAFEDELGKVQVILGSPRAMINDLFGGKNLENLPDWINKDQSRWKQRLASFDKIKADLISRGFSVTEIPMIFLNLSTGMTGSYPVITFNNGLLTNNKGEKTFLSVDFKFGQVDIDHTISRARSITAERLKKIGLNVIFLGGGEYSAANGGLLRCTAGIIGQH